MDQIKQKYLDFKKKYNFYPSKKLGQNFLVDQNIKQKIIDLLNIENNDNVLEIGPGLGALTELIYQKTKNFVVIEFDKKLSNFLTNNFEKLKVINEDILKFNFSSLNFDNYKVISNLPYSISSKIIFKILKESNFKISILMVQKEMADRLVAKCGSKKYNNFTVLLSLSSKIKKIFDVSPLCFLPKPEVFSSIITLEKNENFNFLMFQKLESFLKKCFNQKRKTIFNNLKQFFNNEKIEKILLKNNIDFKTRPEDIEVYQYEKIFLDFDNENI